VLKWYNILIENNLLEFKEEKEETVENSEPEKENENDIEKV
jgi:hypothetical protein